MDDLSARKQEDGTERLRPWRFPKGVSGNPKGRPRSPITRIKEIWEENPELFDEWVMDYLEDKNNRRHVVEMIEGKPKQHTDITSNGETIAPVLVQFIGDEPKDNTDTEGVQETI